MQTMSTQPFDSTVYRILSSEEPTADPEEVATLFGVSVRTAQRWAKRGMYGALATAEGCAVRFRREVVIRAYLAARN